MRIKRITGATRDLNPPDGVSADDCHNLPIRDVKGPFGNEMWSAWELSPTEISQIAAGMTLYLAIHGTSHPMVSMAVGTHLDGDDAPDEFPIPSHLAGAMEFADELERGGVINAPPEFHVGETHAISPALRAIFQIGSAASAFMEHTNPGSEDNIASEGLKNHALATVLNMQYQLDRAADKIRSMAVEMGEMQKGKNDG